MSAAATSAAEPDRTPQPSRVVAEPATAQACAADYAKGESVRANVEQTWANERR